MDKKTVKYIGYVLAIVTLLLGLNGLLGGSPIVWGSFELLPAFALLFVIYYFFTHKQKAT